MTYLIKSAEFIKSAPGISSAPDLAGLPEFVLIGRSNVGKSSFINRMLGRKNLAKTSNTPGKTRLLNFYQINNELVFVDLPGYGYAKVSQSEQQQWRKQLEKYLSKRAEIVLALQLIDSRHGPQPLDIQMAQWLAHQEIPYQVILTKTDKLSKSQVKPSQFQCALEMQRAPEDVYPFSAETGYGREPIWELIQSYMLPEEAEPLIETPD